MDLIYVHWSETEEKREVAVKFFKSLISLLGIKNNIEIKKLFRINSGGLFPLAVRYENE